jgi:small multidrug resistance pump
MHLSSPTLAWLYLALAIVLEVAGTTSMKLSDGLSRPWPTLAIFVCYGLGFSLLTLALRHIELSVAYAIWSGVGTALIAVLGLLWFGENLTLAKFASLALIILGVIGLNLADDSV